MRYASKHAQEFFLPMCIAKLTFAISMHQLLFSWHHTSVHVSRTSADALQDSHFATWPLDRRKEKTPVSRLWEHQDGAHASLIWIHFRPNKAHIWCQLSPSLAPMWPPRQHLRMLPRYSATPCNFLIQLPNVSDSKSKRQGKKVFCTSPATYFFPEELWFSIW